MGPFGVPLTILNTLDPLGKFDGKADEGYLLGYSTSSKAFRVYTKDQKELKRTCHIDFLEDQHYCGRLSGCRLHKEKPFWKILLNDSDLILDSEDVAEKEEQHTLTEAEKVLKDDLERMIAQEIAA
ncbi:hypothetical protein Tco_0441864 [Tanacetum coccineum]